jgi:gliding motility-associated-like protein
MRTFTLLLILAITLPSLLWAQREDYQWRFGRKVGLDFTVDVNNPSLELSNMMQNEGVSSIADAQGNLLFYTNGIDVWDQNGDLMPNGEDLLGNISSTQSALIVQQPGSSRYYIFTTDACDPQTFLDCDNDGLRYTVVDMSLNGGLGDVVPTEKNVQLMGNCSEKITAVAHSNGVDRWIIAAQKLTENFYAYRLTPTGIFPGVVISNLSTLPNPSLSGVSYMKLRPDGQQLAIANRAGGDNANEAPSVLLADFNPATGELTNPGLLTGLVKPYGIAYSPNQRYLYVGELGSSYTTTNGEGGRILQYDLEAGDINAVNNSVVEVFGGSDTLQVGALQQAPDGQILVSLYNKKLMGRIENPNQEGSLVNFSIGDYPWGGAISNQCVYGLPNFDMTYFRLELDHTGDCISQPVLFNLSREYMDSLFWDFGDPGSGAANLGTGDPGSHVFSDTGTFVVTLYAWNDGVVDTLFETVEIQGPIFELGADTTVCEPVNLLLNPMAGPGDYLWQDGSTDMTYLVESAGTYALTVTRDNCPYSDTIQVSVQALPEVSLPADTVLCDGDTYVLKADTLHVDLVTWQDGSTGVDFLAMDAGIYTVVGENSCGTATDTLELLLEFPPDPQSIGADTVICEGDFLDLDANNPTAFSYLWSNGATEPVLRADEAGAYFVVWENDCGETTSNVVDLQVRACGCEYDIPNLFTPDQDGTNDTFGLVFTEDCVFVNFELFIYDRWGELVFSTDNPRERWDGTMDGQPNNMDVYFFRMQLETTEKGEEMRQGEVTLIR